MEGKNSYFSPEQPLVLCLLLTKMSPFVLMQATLIKCSIMQKCLESRKQGGYLCLCVKYVHFTYTKYTHICIHIYLRNNKVLRRRETLVCYSVHLIISYNSVIVFHFLLIEIIVSPSLSQSWKNQNRILSHTSYKN